MDMDSRIFLSLLVYKDIISNMSDNCRQLRYRVLGPMMGTLDGDYFINTNDRKYTSMEDNKTNLDDNIRYAFYKLVSLADLKEQYNSTDIESIVSNFFKEFEKDSYFVISKEGSDSVIMRYDEEKMKRDLDRDIAKMVYGDEDYV